MLTIQPELFIAGSAIIALAGVHAGLGARRRLRDVVAVLTQQAAEIAGLSNDLDAATQRSNDMARRLAWLESRARPSARRMRQDESGDAGRAGESVDVSPRAGVTERRHRVLTLARKGMRGAAIAETLGMPHGEVELIINLGRIG